MVHATAHKRNTEKSSYTTAHDLCDQFVEEHSSPRRRGPRAGAAQQLGAFVCGQLAPVVSLAFVTRRRPLAPPMYVYSVPVRWWWGPQGGRALWALTSY